MTNESTRAWQFQDETPAIVKDYFNAVGIIARLSEEEFDQSLFQHYGFDATEYLEAVKDKKRQERRAALVKTGNLELVLADCSKLDGTRYEAILSWLAEANLPQPSSVLDIGCDTGIMTCFYSMLFPQATITGIDASADAIECARKLAAKLQLKNVQFIKADVLHLPNDLKGQKFDLVCSTFAADRFLSWWPGHEYTVEDLLAGEAWEQTEYCEEEVKYARVLANLLSDDQSKLVSSENVLGPHHWAVWLWSLREAGINVPSDNMDLLEFHDTKYDCVQELPVLVGSKQVAKSPTAEEIRSLWTGGLDESLDQEVYEDLEAESVLMATEPKKLCHSISTGSFQLDNEACMQFWATESHVLIYKRSDFEQKLVRLPAKEPEHVIALLTEVLDDDGGDA